MPRQVFSSCLQYVIEIQEIEGEMHVHCEVLVWSPSVLRGLYKEFSLLKKYLRGEGYGEMFSVSPNPKFCELFCAESLGTFEDYEVMRWDLN